MTTALRRLFWLALVAAAIMTARWAIERRSEPDAPSPEWPPIDPPTTGGGSTSDEPATTWVEPVDGACPDGYPVKVNVKSGIFHVPGGRFYDRTVPHRCYADAAQAEADGYRRAKA